MTDRKIIIFENQFTQFLQIRKKLIGTYNVYPDESKFVKLLEIIKVVLDERYDQEQQKIALSLLKKELNKHEPDALIIDHNLIGLDIPHAGNGIDLARLIDDKLYNLSRVPVLFLSQSLTNTPDIVDGLNNLKNDSSIKRYEWCQKGYSSSVGFDPEFFKKIVMIKLNDLFKPLKEENNETKVGINTSNTPRWEQARTGASEPGIFLSFALKTYWESSDDDGNKRKEIAIDIHELKRWLQSTKEITNKFADIKVVGGYLVSITPSHWRIDNMVEASQKKPYTNKAISKSFATVLKKIGHEKE